MSASAPGRNFIKLPPNGMAVALRAQFVNGISVFLWGPPGVAKSSIAKQVATALGVAFVDERLSQKEPTDLMGLPYLVTQGGVQGVKWSPPFVLPRDVDVTLFHDCEAIEHTIEFYNPRGKNGIHYCTTPEVDVRAVGSNSAVAQVCIVAEDGTVTPIGDRVRLLAPVRSEFDDDEQDDDTPTVVEGPDEKGRIILRTPRLDRVAVALYRLGEDGALTNEMVAGRIRIQARGKSRGILALEEFNSAAQAVQTASYSLVLDRYVGEYHVPKGWTIVAMGNREEDRGITFEMASPISNRFDHLEMDSDPGVFFPDWQQWAIAVRLHPQVVAYISAFKEDLFRFDPNSESKSFPTPRSWEMVSKILYSAEHLTSAVERAKIVGAIGAGVGFKFLQFRKIAADLPKNEDVLSGAVKKIKYRTDIPSEPEGDSAHAEAERAALRALRESGERPGVALQYALATALCFELRNRFVPIVKKHGAAFNKSPEFQIWAKAADTFLDFIMDPDNFQKEVAIMAVRAAIQTYRMPFDTRNVTRMREFAAKHKAALVWQQ